MWRAVDKGATFLSDTEMESFFTSFSEKGYKVAMQTADGTKTYRMTYFEPPISVDTHWVKIFVFDDQREDAKPMSDLEMTRISLALDKPYRWAPVDEQTALLTNALIETEGQYYRGVTQKGDASFRLMYLGPLSEELKRPESSSVNASSLFDLRKF